ncbi:MAG: alpha-amylase, partial [Muribaculaceae bacterium]|nr:alpha-amylase [Muribaculaceae bacterium]
PEDSLFIYGEVLQDKNVKETEYAQYMGLTASNYGYIMREALEAGKFDTTKAGNWYHPVEPSKLVSWVESHDTYCNAHESASLSNYQIRAAWAWITARQFGTPLFYSRPNNSTKENVWGDNIVGARGNDQFIHPEVAAVNKFRTAMSGEAEELFYSDDAKVGEVCRGKKGAVLVNMSSESVSVSMKTNLPNGKYVDAVHGVTFKVKKGVVTGQVAPLASYVLVKK